MNAAGMFKNGESYNIMEAQGAGAYLLGTTTCNAREGNRKKNISKPFAPYPKSGAASNWLGLPNKGDEYVLQRINEIKKAQDFPLGVSVMGSPDFGEKERLEKLIESLHLYDSCHNVDFIEINESCPNTSEGRPQESNLYGRLVKIGSDFLKSKTKPVVVKFSNDTEFEQVPEIMDALASLGFDGVNFGNTSTSYSSILNYIKPNERKLFNYFSNNFGGGVSGRPLKIKSMLLCQNAVDYLKANPPSQEFHVIRTGGIETPEDLEDSERIGVSLNQWFTGYFNAFSENGHKVYQKMLEE